MVRNEQDVIDHVVRHMLNQDLDKVVVADNLSTDDTRDILHSIDDDRLVAIDDKDPAYRQSEKMTSLAEFWADSNDWVVPFDADELWNSRIPGQSLGDSLRSMGASVAAARPWVHLPQPDDVAYHGCPFASMPHRVTTQEAWPKAALRWQKGMTIGQGNHWTASTVPDVLDIRHFQYRSLEQLAAKVRAGSAALSLTNLPHNSGLHWRQLGALDDSGLEDWWVNYTNQPTVFDPPQCFA